MRYSITLLFSLIISFVSAQSTVIVKDNTIDVGLFVPGVNENKYDNVAGSPYLNKDFIPAKVNDIKKTQFVRFNPVDHDVEVKTTKGILRIDITKKYTISLLDGSHKIYETSSYVDEDGVTINTFFERVDGIDSQQLYKRERKKFVQGKKVEGYSDAKPASFKPLSDIYFITNYKTEQENLLEIPRKKKKFYAFFGNSAKIVTQFIKKEKLDFSKEADLVKIFNYYFSTQK